MKKWRFIIAMSMAAALIFTAPSREVAGTERSPVITVFSGDYENPSSMAKDKSGNMYFSDGNKIMKINASDGSVGVFAGSDRAGMYYGTTENSRFNSLGGIAFDNLGNLYATDTKNHVIIKVDRDGKVFIFAGRPGQSGLVNGNTEYSRFSEPIGLFIDQNDVMYIADSGNNCIRRIENLSVTTVAGRPEDLPPQESADASGYVDGDIRFVRFCHPTDVEVIDDKIFVADAGNNAIRVIEDSEVFTFAGNGIAQLDYSSLANMKLNNPTGVSYYADGGLLYIDDEGNGNVISIPLNTATLKTRLNRADIFLFVRTRKYVESAVLFVERDESQLTDIGRERSGSAFYARLTEVLDALGVPFAWNSSDGSIVADMPNGRITLMNGKDFEIENDRAVVEIRELAAALDIRYEWFEEINCYVLCRP